MTIDIEAAKSSEPMASMQVQVVATGGYSYSKNGMPYLTSESVTYQEFCVAVDNLIRSLESLKPKAKLKFAEFDRTSK